MSSVNPEVPADKIVHHHTAMIIPEIRVYSHSSIFYWWPVWVAGFIMAAITWTGGMRAPLVPSHSHYDSATHSIVLPPGAARPELPNGEIGERLAPSKNVGVIFTIVLLMVIFITNTLLRGLWSAIALLIIIVVTVTFAWMGWWGRILHHFGNISIHMNMGFYMFFSTLLFVLWAVVVFGFDRMHYWKFRPSQLTFESLLGGGQKSYDTAGISFEKLRDDIFRHWLLGMGSGDLVIITSGATREQIQIPNVMFLDKVLARLQTMIAEKGITPESDR